jgi:UDP-glucose 4-epimerase
MRVLIPGISGGVARQVARALLAGGHEVIGVDARPWPDAPHGIELHAVDIRKRAAEEVFRRRRPQCVVHMATVSGFAAKDEERYRINLGGTQAVFDHCHAWGVEHVVFVGRHTYYGAGADQPLYHVEDEPPMALASYPELADLVAADLYASTALWRMPALATTILRLVYTLGPSGSGTLASFLRGRAVPMVLGYDPLFQFLHEEDAVRAILLAVEKRPRGVFNVCGPNPVPLSMVAREVRRPAIPLPQAVLERLLGRAGFPHLARGALQHVRYPIVVDGRAFVKATGFAPEHDEVEVLRGFVASFPPR